MAKKSKKEEEAAELVIDASEAEAVASAPEAEDADEDEDVPSDSASEDGEESTPSAPRAKKEKRAVKKRKSKKEKENPLARAVRLAVETGKVEFGAKTGVKDALLGKAKYLVISSNAPRELKEDIEYYSKLSNLSVIVFEGTGIELGSICGTPYSVSVLSVYNEGSANLTEFVKKK